MKKNFTIEGLKDYLTEVNFDCAVQPASDDQLFPELLVFLGHDSKGRERILQIVAKEQLPSSKKGAKESPIFLLDFVVKLPFQVETFTVVEVARLIAFLNRSSDFPGFEMDEVSSDLFFRANLLGHDELSDYRMSRAVIGIVMLHLDLFLDQMEEVSTGKITFNEVLEKGLASLEEMMTTKPIPPAIQD